MRKIKAPGPVKSGARIALLGGSFNPAHKGHLHITRAALRRLHLDYVWWLVSPSNPLKPKRSLAPLARRLAGAKKIAHGSRIRVTAIETKLGTRFTVDTIAALQRLFPQVHFIWLMGSDNLIELPRWRRWRKLFGLVPIAIAPRPGSAKSALRSRAAREFEAARVQDAELPVTTPAWTILRVRAVPDSATRLRAISAWNASSGRVSVVRKNAKGGPREA